jgi:hypothetical protein
MISNNAYNLRNMYYWEMATLIRAIKEEVKHRNPIGVNLYTGYIEGAVTALEEISDGEIGNPTSESGPREAKHK